MRGSVVKFNGSKDQEFFKELRKRVRVHFKESGKSRYANFNMKFKTAFMIALYFVPFICLLTGVVTSVWPVVGMFVLMGFGMAGIGLSIMHDANHGSYSKNKTVNQVLGYLIHFIGGYKVNWKIQHNVLHHSFTNIEGHDDDVRSNLMRFTPNQPRTPMHRFQRFYAPIFYGMMTMYWSTTKDFEQVMRYHKRDLLKSQNRTLKSAMIELSFNKIWYFIITLVLPLILIPIAWWQIVLAFLLMHFICGLSLALIFQPAHVLEETHFYTPVETGSMENNWAIHQLLTTSNFARKSTIFSWLIGGLNYQIEHHLFPNVCHIHYKEISKIVKATAEEYGIPYLQHKTFLNALQSHFSLLHRLGTGSYDKSLAS